MDVAQLLHYASENYDPQKAHEYYLKTRELIGRHSTKGLNQKQREGWSYAQAQVKNAKTNKFSAAREAEKQSIEQARNEALALRKDIMEKLKAFSQTLSKQHSDNTKSISEEAKKQRQAIADKLETDIAALPVVPKNLPKNQREKLLAERSEKIKALRGKASEDLNALNTTVTNARVSEQTSVKETRRANSEDVAKTRAQVATQLKAVVAKYVEQYKSAKTQITSESEATLDKEFNNIKTKVR
jgi:hypothetical protein